MRGGGPKSSGLISLKTSSKSGGSAAGGNDGKVLRRGGEVRMRWGDRPANGVRPACSAGRRRLGENDSGGAEPAGTGQALCGGLREGLRVGEVMMNGVWPKAGGTTATAAKRSLQKRGRAGPLQRSGIG
jgi:hypothetical protein